MQACNVTFSKEGWKADQGQADGHCKDDNTRLLVLKTESEWRAFFDEHPTKSGSFWTGFRSSTTGEGGFYDRISFKTKSENATFYDRIDLVTKSSVPKNILYDTGVVVRRTGDDVTFSLEDRDLKYGSVCGWPCDRDEGQSVMWMWATVGAASALFAVLVLIIIVCVITRRRRSRDTITQITAETVTTAV